MAIQPLAANFISIRLICMLPAIQFYNQPGLEAYKIDHIVTEWLLPFEFMPIKPTSPQVLP